MSGQQGETRDEGPSDERVRLLFDESNGSPRKQCCDVVVVGTGLPESIVAASLARRGETVLHLEPSNSYGGRSWATERLPEVLACLNGEVNKEGAADQKQKGLSPRGQIGVSYPSSDYITDAKVEVSSKYDTLEGLLKDEEVGNAIESLQVELTCGPKVCLGAGDLIETLIASDAHRYLEFKAVQNSYLWVCDSSSAGGEGSFIDLPASRADIFKSKGLDLVEKRLLMRYLKSEQDANLPSVGAPQAVPTEGAADEDDKDLLDHLKIVHKLPRKLRSIVMYGIADLDDQDLGEGDTRGAEKKTSVKEGRERMLNYAKSINRFGMGVGPLLGCNYGNGELAQGFCRLAAVHGATYVLKYAPTEVHISETFKEALNNESNAKSKEEGELCEENYRYKLQIPGAEAVWCNKIVFGPVAAFSNRKETPQERKISRCICVAKSSSASKGGSQKLYVFPPGTLKDNPHTIRALCVHGTILNTCTDNNLVLVYLSCYADEPSSASDKTRKFGHLYEALSKLANLEDFERPNSEKEGENDVLPRALLCMFYNQNFPNVGLSDGAEDLLCVVEKDIIQVGGPDASFGFQSAIRASRQCVKHLCCDDKATLFGTEEEANAAQEEDSEEEAEADYLERVLQSVSKTDDS